MKRGRGRGDPVVGEGLNLYRWPSRRERRAWRNETRRVLGRAARVYGSQGWWVSPFEARTVGGILRELAAVRGAAYAEELRARSLLREVTS